MPITEATRAALRFNQALDPTTPQPKLDRLTFRTAVQSGLLSYDAPAVEEIKWVALNLVMNHRDVPYDTAPSVSAAAWLRRMRWSSGKALKEKFWNDTWQFYIESKLGLELKADAPRKAPHVGSGRGVRKGGDAAMRESMVRSVGAVGNGKATDAGS
jgi:hypothetical protein